MIKTHAKSEKGLRPLCGKRPKLGFAFKYTEKPHEVTCAMCRAKRVKSSTPAGGTSTKRKPGER